MIGLGLTAPTARRASDSEMGMLDVSANALAVLVLATMLIISASAPPAARGEVVREDMPDLFYPSPLATPMTPLSRYVVVLPGGTTVLELDPFAEIFAENKPRAVTPQGEATIVVDRRRYRDLNDYRVRITPDWAMLETQARALDEAAVAEEAAISAALFDADQTATTYLVTVAAMDDFAPLYWVLRNAQTPMRWVTVPPSAPLVLRRSVENFERRYRQWQ